MSPALARRAALVLVLSPVAAAAQQIDASELPSPERFFVRGEYRRYQPSLSGEVQKGTAEQAGTVIDPKRDLGIGDEGTFEVRGALQIRRGHKLRGSYTRLDYNGDVAEARRAFTFDDTRYERFSRVVSSAKGAYYSALYEWDVFKGSRGYFGAVVGAKLLDVDWVIVSTTQGRRELDTLRAPIPVIGGTGRLYFGRISLEGEMVGLTLGERGSLFEGETAVRLHISDRLAVQGGYRLLSVKAEEGRDHGEMRLGGWTFGLELSL